MHEDARFTIRPVSLLGERFVELNQGTPTAPPLPTGATVPLTQTATNTDLDQVAGHLRRPTGAGLAALVTTLGDGVQGNGANTAATLRALSPALTDTDAFVGVLRRPERAAQPAGGPDGAGGCPRSPPIRAAGGTG